MNKHTLAIVVIAALLALLTQPVAAQSEPGADEAALLAEEAELLARVEGFESTISESEETIREVRQMLAELDAEEDALSVELGANHALIESAADELELLALQRREPAIIRARVAIEQFVNGDPAREAFALEAQALGGSDAAQDPLQQQQVFNSIVESAQDDLERLDAEIEPLVASVATLRSAGAEAERRSDEIDATRVELGQRRTAAENAITAAEDDIDEAEVDLAIVAEDLAFYRLITAEDVGDAGGAERAAELGITSRSVLTGRPADGAVDRPALVVKIDNVVRARPQAGINQADVVYVELVEGGFTRYAAVFHSENVGTIGPVRSMRTTDINLLRPLNSPLFASSGGNNGVTQAVNASPLVNISAATGAGGAYFRNSNGRRAPHNLFSTDSALRSSSSAAGSPPRLFTLRRPGTESTNVSTPASGVNVNYRSTSVSYSWNGQGWERTQDGAATVDTAGVRTAPETVIVRFTNYGTSSADAASPEAITVGSGTAWIFTEERLIEGSWSKPGPDSVTAYTDSNGNPVELLPGRVWVELPLPGNASQR